MYAECANFGPHKTGLRRLSSFSARLGIYHGHIPQAGSGRISGDCIALVTLACWTLPGNSVNRGSFSGTTGQSHRSSLESTAPSQLVEDGMYFPGTILPAEYVVQNPNWRWPNPGGQNPPKGTLITITYSIAGLNDTGLPCSQLRAAIKEALGLWAQYAPLKFVEVADSGPCPSSGDSDYATGKFGQYPLRHAFD